MSILKLGSSLFNNVNVYIMEVIGSKLSLLGYFDTQDS